MKKCFAAFVILVLLSSMTVRAEDQVITDFIMFTISVSEPISDQITLRENASIETLLKILGNESLNRKSKVTEIQAYLTGRGATLLPTCRHGAKLGEKVGSGAVYDTQYMEKTGDTCYQLKSVGREESSRLVLESIVTNTETQGVYNLKSEINLKLIGHREKLKDVNLDIGRPHFVKQHFSSEILVPQNQWTEVAMVKLTEPDSDLVRFLVIWTMIQPLE